MTIGTNTSPLAGRGPTKNTKVTARLVKDRLEAGRERLDDAVAAMSVPDPADPSTQPAQVAAVDVPLRPARRLRNDRRYGRGARAEAIAIPAARALAGGGGATITGGGAGTIYSKAIADSVATILVDNGGLRGTNTAVLPSGLNTNSVPQPARVVVGRAVAHEGRHGHAGEAAAAGDEDELGVRGRRVDRLGVGQCFEQQPATQLVAGGVIVGGR